MPNHDKHDKWSTLLSIWICGLLMTGCLIFAPSVSATSGSGHFDLDADGTFQSTSMGSFYSAGLYAATSAGPYYPFLYADLHGTDSIPLGATITGAYLVMYQDTTYSDPHGHTLYAYRETNGVDWSEGSPPAGGGSVSFAAPYDSILLTSGNHVVNMTVTDVVAAQFAIDGKTHFMLDCDVEYECNSDSGGWGPYANAYLWVTWTYTAPPATWAPTFTSSPATTGTVGVQYSYYPTTNETSGYYFDSGPAWANSYVDGWINGTPVANGVYPFEFSATSTNGTLTTHQFWNVTVALGPVWNPTITSSSAGHTSAYKDDPYYYNVTANQTCSWSMTMTSPVIHSSQQLVAVADSYVDAGQPNSNYGTLQDLERGYIGSDLQYIYLRWTPYMLPAGAVIDHAYLWMYMYSSSSGTTMNIGPSTSTTWGETSITWNNAGNSWYNGEYVSMPNSGLGWHNYTSSTLDTYLAGQYADTSRISVMIASTQVAGDFHYYYSKEYSDSAERPYIILQYHYSPSSWASIDSFTGKITGTPTILGTYNISIEASNLHSGHAWQNYSIDVTIGPPATYIDVIFSTANNTHFYINESFYIWWNWTVGSYAFSHIMSRNSINNGSSWLSWQNFDSSHYTTGDGIGFSGDWIMQDYAVDVYGYAGPVTSLYFHFIYPPPLAITSTAKTTGLVNVSYSYQLLANLTGVTWSQASNTVVMAGENPSADSSIFSYNPNTNYGNLGTLYTYNDYPANVMATFLWDSISIPAGATITNVALHAYKTFDSGAGAMSFYSNDDWNWTELGVTWNTEVGHLNLLSGYVVEFGTTGWKTYSTAALTAWCSAQYASWGHISFTMATNNYHAEKHYDSMDGANHPYLVITYSSPSFTTINPATGLLTGTPTIPGNYSVNIEATHGTQHAWQNFTIHVVIGWGPTFTSSPALTGFQGINWTYHVVLNESVTYESFTMNAPGQPYPSVHTWGAHFTSAPYGGYIAMIFSSPGIYNFTFEFRSNAGGQLTAQTWTMTVYPPLSISITAPANNTVVPYPFSLTVNWTVIAGYYPLSFYQYRVANSTMVWGAWSAHVIVTTHTYTATTNGYFEVKATDTHGDVATVYIHYTLGAIPPLVFTSTPGGSIVVMIPYEYQATTNLPSTMTIIDGPSWLSISGGKLHGSTSEEGMYHITIKAHSALGGTDASQTFDLRVLPLTNGYGTGMNSGWLLVIPIIMLFVVVIACCVTREGMYYGGFVGSLTVGAWLLIWCGALPLAAAIVPAFLLGIMLFRLFREVF